MHPKHKIDWDQNPKDLHDISIDQEAFDSGAVFTVVAMVRGILYPVHQSHDFASIGNKEDEKLHSYEVSFEFRLLDRKSVV